ncbi:malate dehydrogenase [Pseudomonas aeruginosa]|nr:malate dehydrogenase [Pseudomonas aeruginosa]
MPALGDIREVSKRIAVAVAKQAQAEGKALQTSDEALNEAIEANFWFPALPRLPPDLVLSRRKTAERAGQSSADTMGWRLSALCRSSRRECRKATPGWPFH